MKYESLYERLIANSEIPEGQSETTGCWLWTGNTDRKGYGRLAMRVPGKPNPTGVRAHRAMEGCFHDEPLHPDNETIEHLCTTTGCINPDHFGLMTRAENTSAAARRRNGR